MNEQKYVSFVTWNGNTPPLHEVQKISPNSGIKEPLDSPSTVEKSVNVFSHFKKEFFQLHYLCGYSYLSGGHIHDDKSKLSWPPPCLRGGVYHPQSQCLRSSEFIFYFYKEMKKKFQFAVVFSPVFPELPAFSQLYVSPCHLRYRDPLKYVQH